MSVIRRSPATGGSGRRRAGGFSLIEVLIALIVLALGLLGFALLQTMNLRYTQSANYRTQATHLAYDLLDQMRANRFQAVFYSGDAGASFDAGDVEREQCSRDTGDVTIAGNVARWQCRVVAALGEAASADVTYDDGLVGVTLTWGERVTIGPDTTTFRVETQL